MKKIGIAVHGGAGHDSAFLKKNRKASEAGLAAATELGFNILKKGGSALRAVEEAVKCLEDNAVFNAGCGSALNNNGEVEMDASIMDGKTLRAGAVAMLRSVKNPISAAKLVLRKSKHVLLSGYGALEFAINQGLPIEPDNYFMTEHAYQEYLEECGFKNKIGHQKKKGRAQDHGTVGAVALDKNGNLAAGTSTGGICNSLPGRVGDSCIIGAGCYANNQSCAVSCTGHGEFIITGVIAHTIAMILTDKKWPIQKVCDFVINKKNQYARSGMGFISIDRKANFGIAYNTEVMKRAWMSSSEELVVFV